MSIFCRRQNPVIFGVRGYTRDRLDDGLQNGSPSEQHEKPMREFRTETLHKILIIHVPLLLSEIEESDSLR